MSELIRQVARRRWLKRIIHPVLPTISSFPVEKGRAYYCVKDFTGPSFYIMYDGVKAFYAYEQINKNAIEPYLSNDAVFFDIGANIGLFSLYFKMKFPKLQVHAFEPEELNYSCLKNSIESFAFDNFTLNKLGLSDTESDSLLYVDHTNMGGSSVDSENRSGPSQSIKLTTLDNYVRNHKIERIDVIKIDVEGLEEKIIYGGIETLKRFKPKIIFECIHFEIEKNNVIRALVNRDLEIEILQVKTGKIIASEDFAKFVKSELDRGLILTEYLVTIK